MSQSEPAAKTCLNELPSLPRDDKGPVFEEPWQAQAFAVVLDLAEHGYITWSEWAEALGAELSAAAEAGNPDDGSRYYHHWVTALEKLVTSKQVTDMHALDECKAAWESAYLNTPHGKPVELKS